MDPEYSFDEMIELIRQTETLKELQSLSDIVRRDGRKYCLYHLELLVAAIRLNVKYMAQEDARELKRILKHFGL